MLEEKGRNFPKLRPCNKIYKKQTHFPKIIQMYDNIKIIQYIEKINDLDVLAVKQRFSMYNENLRTGAYNNAGYQKLAQNRGVFLSYVPKSGNINEHYILQLSLHKFWNCWKTKQLQNYNTFTISDLLETWIEFQSFIPFSLAGAKVQGFEAGANIQVSKNPSDYMRQISHIQIGRREIRIIENPKYKEYKNYTSHSDRDKRAVYSFYDKTEESKPFAPENLLRIEKKYIRMADNPLLCDIFHQNYIQAVKTDLYNSFVKNLYYHKKMVQQKGVNDADFHLLKLMQAHGDNIRVEIKRQKDNKEISRLKYYRLLERLEKLERSEPSLVMVEMQESKEFREKIAQNLKKL